MAVMTQTSLDKQMLGEVRSNRTYLRKIGEIYMLRVRIKKKGSDSQCTEEFEEQLCNEMEQAVFLREERYEIDLGRIDEDKSVRLFKRWKEFVNSLSNEEKQQIRVWACPTTCSPNEIDRLVKATKGMLEKATK